METTADLNKIKESVIDAMIKNFKNDGKILPLVMILEPNGKMNYIRY